MKKVNKIMVGDFIRTTENFTAGSYGDKKVLKGIPGMVISISGSFYLCRLKDNTPGCTNNGGLFRTKCAVHLLEDEITLI